MTFAVISDIHGDLAALRRVMSAIDDQEIKTVLCLGDIIGTGGHSKECWDIVKARCARVLAGNHDRTAQGHHSLGSYREVEQEAIQDAGYDLMGDERFMALDVEDDYHAHGIKYSLYHASPAEPTWEHITCLSDVQTAFQYDLGKMILFGHTHIPAWADTQDNFHEIDRGANPVIQLEDDRRYLINPGAVLYGRYCVVTDSTVSWHTA